MARKIPNAWIFQAIFVAVAVFTAHAGWVDPDTAPEKFSTKSLVDGTEYTLVMSDEFNEDGRTFNDGDDTVWTGTDHSDDANTGGVLALGSLHFYNHSNIGTNNGVLNITTTSEHTKWRGWNPYKKHYETLEKEFRSGMISSWNKFCFTGGIIEVTAQLPGYSDIGGLWPAIWLLGNLGRATFEGSTNLIWPWSYDKCNRKLQEAQTISACNRVHHFGMQAGKGRGSTEIDIMEAMAGKGAIAGTKISLPYFSSTLQVAPGVPTKRPGEGVEPGNNVNWYRGMKYGDNTHQNVFFFGSKMATTSANEPTGRSAKQEYIADAVGGMTNIDESYWTSMATYRLEWQPGKNGSLNWYVNDTFVFGIEDASLDFMGSQIPQEPSYVILNTAVSSSWGFPLPCPPGCDCSCFDCGDPKCMCGMPPGFCASLPSFFLIDSVRVYQNKNDPKHYTGCDPPGFPTKRFITAYQDKYKKEGSTRMMAQIRTGNGKCKTDDDCGLGTCSFWSGCQCPKDRRGPNCRARYYFEDNEGASHVSGHIPVHMPIVPFSLQVFAITMVVAYVSSIILVLRGKQQARRRQLEALSRETTATY